MNNEANNQRIMSLVLWQPWASALFTKTKDGLLIKKDETRGRKCSYRGDLLICSAVKSSNPEQKECFQKSLNYCGLQLNKDDSELAFNRLPFGKVLGIVTMTDCVLMTPEVITKQSQMSLDLGIWEEGRYQWTFENHRPVKPFSSKGLTGQGFRKIDLNSLNLEFLSE
jgi:hypothetical protein